ncbi:MAG: hypothetical protein IH613_13380 [Desulfuromonadales bacterium]|nr:hypothetical protein [Desulfuromonadales bacterium]
MDLKDVPDFRTAVEDLSADLNYLRQNRLLNETAFIRFAKDCGVPVSGVGSGDPGNFYERGWITCDAKSSDGPLFHPYRFYSLQKALEKCYLPIAASSTLKREGFTEFIENVLKRMPNEDQIGESTRQWDSVINLAILLEPIYWPRVTGWESMPGGLTEIDYKNRLDQYRHKINRLMKSLDQTFWRKVHESLRVDAGRKDKNDSLYLLLRLSSWSEREKLKGTISGALWLRHIAEVFRLAFEESFNERWAEEDEALGHWYPGARMSAYGSERPLDDVLKSKPYLALRYELFTGSAVRWYVEGETEYYAILHVLIDPSKSGIEIVNLRGVIQSDKDNIALKLRDWLKEDLSLRRFSIISFDTDVGANVKSLRRQVEQKNIVGLIAAHKPDFEFANFTIQELVEIAAQVDERHGASGDAVRDAGWKGVVNGKAFEEKYRVVSARRPRGLKGKEWGEAMAKYASEYPRRTDDGKERPFWREIQAALQSRISDYDFQKQSFGFDIDTFELLDLRSCEKKGLDVIG